MLLFGSETLVLTARMEKALDTFQSRVARKTKERQPWRRINGTWYFPSLAGAMKESGILRIWT